jgi:hypothetical protein
MILQKLLSAKQNKLSKLFYSKNIFLLLLCCISYVSSYSVSSPPVLRKACLSPNKDIVLYWTPTNDTCSSFIQYKIFARKTSSDPFVLLDSVNNINQNSYTHFVSPPSSNSWEYYMVCENDCNGFPTSTSDTISIDLTAPSTTDPDSVSINPLTGDIIIGWKKNTTPDLFGYTIYDELGASIGNTTDTFYIIKGKNIDDSVYTYKIAAFDSCINLSPSITTHSTIQLKGILDDCLGKVDLTWTPYKGWAGIQKYDVFVSRNGGSYLVEESTDGSTLNATLTSVLPGDFLNVYIRAYNSLDINISSSSNMFKDSIAKVKLPKINYLSLVSIVDNKYAQIKWVSDTAGEISFFKIKRGKDTTNFEYLADISFDKNKNEYIYEDKDPKAVFSDIIYYYQIEVFDNCKNPTGSLSNISNTVISKTFQNPFDSTQNTIIWNKYRNFLLDVGYYYVYRGLEFNGVYEWTIIGSTKPTDTFFVDENTPSEAGNTGICYRVDAYENPGNIFTTNQEISVSSRTCELKDFTLYFPTAFNPFGINRKWVPKGSYINYEKTEVKIYNQWGQYITTITDLHKGWDGKDDKGEWLQPGSYIYYATITGVNKRKETVKGDFVYLR